MIFKKKTWRGLTDKELLELVRIIIPKASRFHLPYFKAHVDRRYPKDV